MIQVIFLGTGASVPTANRNSTSTLVIHHGKKFLIDVAEGTQRQILISNLGFKNLEYVLLTHHHPDHIIGLGSLFFTFDQIPPHRPVRIFGNSKTIEKVSQIANLVWEYNHDERNNLIQLINMGEENTPIFQTDDILITSFSVPHGQHRSRGFIFHEKEHRKFLTDEADRLGVPYGPERKLLSRGETIQLSDGRTIAPNDVLGPWVPGAKFVYVGDCNYTDDIIEYASNADCLVLEATFLSEEEDLAMEYGHLTARQAAFIAKQAGVKALYLNHRSPRYRDEEILKEAMYFFAGTQIAVDFEHLEIQAIR